MSVKPEAEGLKYGLPHAGKGPESLDFSSPDPGQRNPQHCPYPMRTDSAGPSAPDPLGEPMSIGQVAAVLGCSVWTVRQRYLPLGLPFFRIGSTGKFVFYRNQVVRWLLNKQQQKGGDIR